MVHHSYYSLHYGVRSPREIVEAAVQQGDRRLLLADVNTTGGLLEALRLGEEQGLRVIPGVDAREGMQRRYLLLPRDEEGFAEMNRLLSRYWEEGAPWPDRPEMEYCEVVYPWEAAPEGPLAPNEWLGLPPEKTAGLAWTQPGARRQRMVMLYDNDFPQKRAYNAHRLLRAIGQNTLLSKLPAAQQAPARLGLWSEAAAAAAYEGAPDVVRQTETLLARCQVRFEMQNYRQSQNQRYYTGSAAEDRTMIRRLCQEGLEYRFGAEVSTTVQERLENELQVIEQRDFFGYFLINWDIVQYARRRGFFHIGRGSGANSLVAYLLGITDVDPVALDLYFERFINMSRRQPPDFDIDFSWRDRPEITQYIFERFPRAALLGSYTTFKFKALARELGKVLGLPAAEIEQISKPGIQAEQLDDLQRLVLKYGQLIRDFPHHRTVHASGIIIPEKEVHYFGATFLPPKGFRTVHFDMYAAEDVGLYKFDILGQRGLGKIKDAVRLVKERHPEAAALDIHHVAPFYRDEKIKTLLREGRTMACFYVESPAMRGLLKKLRVDNYITLVAASSIIRPGVSQSGMMAEYIHRYRNPERRKYIHPKMGEILAETYGVMVYQEDVLRVAHYFAGLTLEEADVLRRGMSWKFRERNQFDSIKAKFFSNCRERGYPEEVSAEVWRQIESFGNYAFAKGHSASYAVESYQSLYLKAHYPLEYMTAVINNGGGFYSVETYLNEARLHGATVEPPCINRSGWETRLLDTTLILGFQHLKDLEQEAGQALLKERAAHGPYTSLQNLLDRVAISLEQLTLLIRIRALRSLEPDTKKLLWEAHFRLSGEKRSQPVPDLFRAPEQKVEIPELEHDPHEAAVEEIELLGFPLSSPFELVRSLPENTLLARDLPQHIGRKVRLCGYLIHVKNVTTRGDTPRRMQFGCFLDREGQFIDSVHFPPLPQRYPFRGRGIYLLEGRVQEEYDHLTVEASYLERLPYRNFEEI
ncbi:MAG: DNA polymerase III subunit alpha [Schleiferiaceae bacterium]|nr:DNA polymerase III subunit alpha [Schleiferiaceae bacterium]